MLRKQRDYESASTWAIDRYRLLDNRLYQCKFALLISGVLNSLLCIAVFILSNNQILFPLLIHHYDNGVVTVDALGDKNEPNNKNQVESDIARYVTNRESYSTSSYQFQFELMQLLSTKDVFDEYDEEQRKENKNSPVNILGVLFNRYVHIYSINFLDKFSDEKNKSASNHHNLAEVVFMVTDENKQTSKKTSKVYTALISWQYLKPSTNPKERWLNWDGYQVVRYTKQERNTVDM